MVDRIKRNKKKKQRVRIGVAITSVFVIVGIVLAIKFIPREEQHNLQVAPKDENAINSKDEPNIDNEDKTSSEESNIDENNGSENDNILDNSSYLSLENDPNADDAALVAENTKGLLNGSKTYPVRTDGKKVVYLTFDDGPSTTNTPKILDILDTYNVKATFFVLGKSLEGKDEAKNILKDIGKKGHAIANHTYGHNYSYLYPNRTMNVDNIISDIKKNEDLMKEILGQDFSTRVVRFPGGYWSWEGRTPMRDRMIEEGYHNVDWNSLNGDAEGSPRNSAELLQRTKDTVEILGPNADSVVLLMHDTYGKEETVNALPSIIEYLQSQGYEFRTIK